jgi:iron complex outermembrane receptor protein
VRALIAVAIAGSCWSAAHGASPTLTAGLADLSLEQLGSVVVSGVSGRDEPLSRAPASIYVITGDEIRRSGRNSLAEVLRLAPNLDVARVDANQYAITARGFNNTLANKLLVMIDGRTVYTPLFSGTFWEAQDVMLEDIDRIEVISGAGATLWGANAVNGVINILTKRASATQGITASVRAGTSQNDGASRYGGELPGGHYRVYGKAVRRENTVLGDGRAISDLGEQVQGGFRADWGRPGHGFTLQGDAYEGAAHGQGRDFSGLNVLGRLTRDLGDGAELRLQGYFSRTARQHVGVFEEDLDTYDFELQHGLERQGAHHVLWGMGARRHESATRNSALIVFQPETRELDRRHVFLQDEIALRPDLDLTLGGKLERNTYTGNEFLPTARLGWRPDEARLLWMSASRAIRAPSRVDRDLFSPLTVPPLVGGSARSEVVKVYEIGWRAQASRRVSYSATAFYNEYERIRTIQATPAGLMVTNDREGSAYGVEGWATWHASDRARLSGGLVSQRFDLRDRAGVPGLLPSSEANDSPYWVKLRASFDVAPAWELDVFLRHYAARPDPQVPAYTAIDARVGWRLVRDAELSFALQNLTDRRHPEWGMAASRAELERGAFVQLRVGL